MKLFFAIIQIGFCLPHYSDLSKLIENYQTLVRFTTDGVIFMLTSEHHSYWRDMRTQVCVAPKRSTQLCPFCLFHTGINPLNISY